MNTDSVIAELNAAADRIRARIAEIGEQLDGLVEEREALEDTLRAYEMVISTHRMHHSHLERQEDMFEASTTDGNPNPQTVTVKEALRVLAERNGGVIRVPAAAKQLFNAGYFVDYSGGRDVIHATLRRAVAQNDGWKKTGRGRYELVQKEVA